MEDVRSELNSHPSTSSLWRPSDGQSRDDWLRCHGQPADVCRRTRQKLSALKKLIASEMPPHQNQQPQPMSTSLSVIIVDLGLDSLFLQWLTVWLNGVAHVKADLDVKTFFTFFTARRNARIASSVLATAIPSVRLSVRPSVCHTPVLYQKDGM